MDIRSLSAKKAFIISASGGALIASAAQADNFHPGRVVERGSNAPISSDIKAWEPSQRSDLGNCPEYGSSPIDAQISDISTGEFGLKVPTELRNYHVVYCANGYHNRVDRHVPNEVDGSPVIPTPAQLRRQSESEVEQSESKVETDTVRITVYALNELTYLYEVNPDAFNAALSEYREIVSERDGAAAEVLGTLPNLIAQWASSQ